MNFFHCPRWLLLRTFSVFGAIFFTANFAAGLELTLSGPQSVREGEEITMVVELSEPLEEELPLNYRAFDSFRFGGSRGATHREDYDSSRGSFVLPAGETSFGFQVDTYPDNRSEGVETLEVLLAVSYEGSLLSATHAVSILDDEVDLRERFARVSADSSDLSAIADSGTRLVVVGEEGLIASSDDGTSWVDHRFEDGPDFLSVQFSEGEFLTLGLAASNSSPSFSYAFSNNGEDWELREFPDEFQDENWVDAVSRGGERFFLSESGGVAVFNVSEGSWELRGNLPEEGVPWRGFVWDGSEFVAISSFSIARSTDGIVWTVDEIGLNLFSLRWLGDSYLATSFSGFNRYRSEDGSSWVDETPVSRRGTARQIVVRGEEEFRVGADGNVTRFNLLDESVTTAHLGPDTRLSGCCYGGGRYLAVGNNGAIFAADVPQVWELVAAPVASPLFDVIWDGGQYVIVGGDGTVLTSPNAEVWTKREVATNYWLRSVAYNGSLYVAVGYGGTMLTSSDSVTWVRQTLGSIEHRFRDVHWTGAEWLIVGESEVAFRGNADLSELQPFVGPSNGGSMTYASILEKEGRLHLATNAGYFFSDNGSYWTLGDNTPVGDVAFHPSKGLVFAEQRNGLTDYAVVASPDAVVTCGTSARIRYQLFTEPVAVSFVFEEVLAIESEGVVLLPIQLEEALSEDLTLGYRAFVRDYYGFNYRWGRIPDLPTPNDYQEDGRFTIPAGTTSYTLAMPVINDELAEPDEVLQVGLVGLPVGMSFQSRDTVAKIVIRSDDDFILTPRTGSVVECGELIEPVVNRAEAPAFIRPLAEGDGDFVVEAGGDYFYTEDGIELTPLEGLSSLRNVYWTGEFYLAIGGRWNDEIFRFTDAEDVQQFSTPNFERVLAGNWNGSEFVMGFYSRETRTYSTQTSPDGEQWTAVTTTLDGEETDTVFPDLWSSRLGRYFDFSTNSTSVDGVQWSLVPLDFPGVGTSFFESESHLYLYSREAIFESVDGQVWQDITPPELDFYIDDAATDGTVIAFFGLKGALLFRDENGWHHRPLGTDADGVSVSYSSLGWYLDLGDSALVSSTQSLEDSFFAESPHYYDVIWTEQRYLVCGEMGTVLESSDGSEWNEVATPVDWVLRSLATDGQTVIAVGNGRAPNNDGAVLRSTDGGLSWSEVGPLPAASWLHAAFWTGERFVIGGANGSIHYSTDGLSWVSAQSATSERIYSFASDPTGTLVAVGASGVALRSDDWGLSWLLADEGVPNVRGRENRFYAVTWTGSEFLAVGRQYPDDSEFIIEDVPYPTGNLLISTDGVKWTRRNSFVGGTFFDVLPFHDSLLALREGGAILGNRPQQSLIWSGRNDIGGRAELRAFTTNDETIVIVGERGLIRVLPCEVQQAFEHWLTDFGLTGGAAAPDAVNNPFGIPNALAYAWRLDPYEGDAEWQSPLTVLPGDLPSEVMLREPTQTFSSVGYYFESSINLVDWEIVARREPFSDWVESFNTEIEESEGFREITFERLAIKRRQFFRLRVELP